MELHRERSYTTRASKISVRLLGFCASNTTENVPRAKKIKGHMRTKAKHMRERKPMKICEKKKRVREKNNRRSHCHFLDFERMALSYEC